MNRVGIFYLSFAPGPNRQPIALPGGGVCYVRVYECRGDYDEEEALAAATPEGDELVMNTHYLLPMNDLRAR